MILNLNIRKSNIYYCIFFVYSDTYRTVSVYCLLNQTLTTAQPENPPMATKVYRGICVHWGWHCKLCHAFWLNSDEVASLVLGLSSDFSVFHVAVAVHSNKLI